MALFSERYGYTKPSDIIIRESITPEIQNAICSCYDRLFDELRQYDVDDGYVALEHHIWLYFLNEREGDFVGDDQLVTDYIEEDHKWYEKIDLIEFSIKFLYQYFNNNSQGSNTTSVFVHRLNKEFKRLNFAYRIVDSEVVEITTEEEIVSIEDALKNSTSNIRTHLNKALELYAQRPNGDYRNSIKESISAVEAASRNITGENVLNFKKMEEKGILISPVLRQAFEKLYGYTNDKSTGIRHALMDDTNAPETEEALFMLVSCSAFINYLNKKINK